MLIVEPKHRSKMLGGKGDVVKIYRGAFDYFRGMDLYAEETFEVFKSNREQFFRTEARIIGRVSTGETLSINVHYETSLKWVPNYISINKVLGNQNSTEIFIFDPKNNKLLYNFKGVESEGTAEISVGTKFSISTPAASTCLMFIKSKKMNTTSKNIYQVVVSNNEWKYTKPPHQQGMSFERVSSNKEQLRIGGANLAAYKYKFCEENLNADSNTRSIEKPPFLEVLLSKHIAIPYEIKTPLHEGEDPKTQTRILVKYLNEIEEDA
jgi:hypothetical protein